MYKYYYKYYYNIINDIIEKNNILLVIDNEFNILEEFSHIIKKNDTKINILINDYKIYNRLLENIKGEECAKNVDIYIDIENIKNNIDFVVIFHMESINKTESILLSIHPFINENSLLYIYCSLSIDTNRNNFKNSIREKIMQFTNNKIGFVLPYEDVINAFNSNKNYKMESIMIYKKNNYIIYGNNTVYEIILKKI